MSLRIDTSLTADNLAPKSPDALSATTPTTRERTLSITHGIIPVLRRPTSEKSPLIASKPDVLQGSSKARQESKKLLSHVLAQLKRRDTPPPAYESWNTPASGSQGVLGAAVRSFTGRRKRTGTMTSEYTEDGAKRPRSPVDDSDDDTVEEAPFYSDDTCDLMCQLRDVLKISLLQSWDVFAIDDSGETPARHDSNGRPRRKRRLSSQVVRGARSRSRSASPARDEAVQPLELFDECIAILSSVVTEDCRFQIRAPRLMRPPYALQAVTLDVAQLLMHNRRHDPRSLSLVGFAVLPAFRTFKPPLHPRLLAFFDEGVIANMLDIIATAQSKDESHSPNTEFHEAGGKNAMVITVEEAPDEPSMQPERWKRWSKMRSKSTGFRSATAPGQDVALYYLTSLVQPVLSSIFEHVEVLSTETTTAQRFNRFIAHLRQRKPDMYLDLLGVIAYHVPRARYVAASFLASFWPKALGHSVITRPVTELPTLSHHRRSTSRPLQHPHEHSYDHQFIPWKFAASSLPAIYSGFSPSDCRICSSPVTGFGLLCPFCLCSVHFDCYDYPEGSFFTEYSLSTDSDIRKVAVHKFCFVQPQRGSSGGHVVRKERHVFRWANVFSLCLCFICRKPLWGYTMQGLACDSCHQFAHAECLTSTAYPDLPRCRSLTVDSSTMTISYSTLRRSFVDHFRQIIFKEDELSHRTYEELSIFYAVLWAQLEILENGLALGSIVVSQDTGPDGDDTLQDFELHYFTKLYEAYVASGRLPVSGALQDYLTENQGRTTESNIIFDLNVLAFVASVMKLADASTLDAEGSSELLGVSQLEFSADDSEEPASHPYEIVPLGHLRDRLGESLQIYLDSAAAYLITHMQQLGLLDRCDHPGDVIDSNPASKHVKCCFPIPFGLEISVDVETLVAAIEACLLDINLSINEVGFLLLVRRLWPNGMLSDYTFRRVAKSILLWIISEDSNLAVILRDFVARGRMLPGVRPGGSRTWPPQPQSRPAANAKVSNGGDYVASRRALLTRYAAPWMLALHDQDIMAYGNLLYDLLAENAAEYSVHDPLLMGTEPDDNTQVMDKVLKYVIKASQASVIFSASDLLFERWLNDVHSSWKRDQPLVSLPRLFSREDGTQRQSAIFDSRMSMTDLTSLSGFDPFQTLVSIAFVSSDTLRQGLFWLSMFGCSGIDIPTEMFSKFEERSMELQLDLDDYATLIKAGLYTCWLKSIGRQDLQAVIGTLLAHFSHKIVQELNTDEKHASALTFVRQSLSVCLLLYGCERPYLISQDLVLHDEIAHLPSRRKVGSRGSIVTDPIIVDSKIMRAIRLFIKQGVEDLSCLIVKFLHAFASEASLVESYEVDNFILRNGDTLCLCVWESYGIQVSALGPIRASLLARVLAVDAQPFQVHVSTLLHQDTPWETRLNSILRLFRIILDVNSPSFAVEDRQWRSSVIDVFQYFFSSIWMDGQEEIRAAADTWAQTLLPAHFEAIALCWNEALSKATIGERVKLVTFLLQLRSHFPAWRVLTWETIIETLLENEFLQENGNDDSGIAGAHLSIYGLPSSTGENNQSPTDPELMALRIALVSLSLRMMADGINIDVFSLLRIKDKLLRVMGFEDVALVPSSSGHTFHVQFQNITKVSHWAYPCIADLVLVFDAAHAFEISCSAMGGPHVDDESPVPLLIGSPFVDILIGIFGHAKDLALIPPLTLKDLLQCFIIVMQKHDFDSKPLQYLHTGLRDAARYVLALARNSEHLSQELRQLALSTVQVFAKRWPQIMSTFIIEIVDGVSRLLVSIDYTQFPEDGLVMQGRKFLEAILSTFCNRGVLHLLFKKHLEEDLFGVLRYTLESVAQPVTVGSSSGSLKDILIHDTFSRLVDGDEESMNLTVLNLHKFIEVVHHSRYSADLLNLIGTTLVSLSQRVTAEPYQRLDPSPIVAICSTLIDHNKAQSREFLPTVEVILRTLWAKASLSTTCLYQLLETSSNLYRKVEPKDQAFASNHIAVTVVNALSEALVGKSRMHPSSLAGLIQAITANGTHFFIPLERLVRLAEDAMVYLQTFGSLPPSQPNTLACRNIAEMAFEVAREHPRVIFSLDQRPLDIRTWNLITLASLRKPEHCMLLMSHFQAFVQIYHAALNLEDVDISRAYISIKLWLLLARQAASSAQAQYDTSGMKEAQDSMSTYTVWNELWPAFDAVISTQSQDGNTKAILLATNCIADLVLFLHQSQSELLLELASQLELLNRVRNGSNDSKINRVLRLMHDPPQDTTTESLILQTAAEIEAEEKLEVAKWYENARNLPERGRRIVS